MASKVSRKKVMEWASDVVQTTNATVRNGRIDLGLRDGQLAEIHQIDSYMNISNIPDAANDDVYCSKIVSMDPDYASDPELAENIEDLETITTHRIHIQQEVGAAGTAALRNHDSKIQYFDPPILVGTDIAQAVKGDAAIACSFETRVFFTRRKATDAELGQVLLKRR